MAESTNCECATDWCPMFEATALDATTSECPNRVMRGPFFDRPGPDTPYRSPLAPTIVGRLCSGRKPARVECILRSCPFMGGDPDGQAAPEYIQPQVGSPVHCGHEMDRGDRRVRTGGRRRRGVVDLGAGLCLFGHL